LQRKFEGAGLKFDPVSFTYSFRSGPAILHAVDQVFHEQDIFRSIHAVDIGNPIHHALADAGPSQIDLWELAEADDRQDIEGWRAPFDGVVATSPEVKLSRRIQAEIKTLVGSAVDRQKVPPPPAMATCWYGAAARQCVRRRDPGAEARHPVAGADRLLTEHIAIIDLMNLADALLLPQDDLALAVALKSRCSGLATTTCSNSPGSARDRCARPFSRAPRATAACGMRYGGLSNVNAALPAKRHLRSMPGCSAATVAARGSCGGSDTRPTTRSTNSWNWR
jgi:ATP-dependent exoDNAse (exonuclease V) beta subunit